MIRVFILNLVTFTAAKAINTLPETIQKKTQGYTLERKQHEFIASQWLRYHVLTHLLNCKNEQLCFCQTDKGRPYLSNHPEIDFNISHTKKHAVIAVASKNIKVGVDVQECKANIDILAIAKQYYAEHEYRLLLKLLKDQQLDYFYQLWTHKEASLKLTGQGIAHGLKDFSFCYEANKLTPYSHASKQLYYYSKKFNDDALFCLACTHPISEKNTNFTYL